MLLCQNIQYNKLVQCRIEKKEHKACLMSENLAKVGVLTGYSVFYFFHVLPLASIILLQLFIVVSNGLRIKHSLI